MFDFENLEVYKKAKAFNTEINSSIIRNKNLDGVVKNQLRRASLSIVLNIAEAPVDLASQTERTIQWLHEALYLNV